MTIKSERIDTTAAVFEAVRELGNLDQPATRETVQSMTGLKLSIVDDRLKTLVDDERLRRVSKGYYGLVQQFGESRIISVTHIPDGRVKIELGDDMWVLKPHEVRVCALALSGYCDDARAVMFTKPLLAQNADLASQLARLESQVKALKAEKDPSQLDLLPTTTA